MATIDEQSIVTADVIITDRGGANERRLVGTDLALSKEINAAGSLSFRVPVDDVRRAGLGVDLRGYWLTYEHPSAGEWSGVVTASPESDGISEVVAQGFAILLRKRLVKIGNANGDPITGTPGAIFRSAYQNVANEAPTMLTLGSVDLSGPAIEAAWEYEDFYESVAPQLTTDSGYEWRVDNDRVITFAPELGTDRSSSVLFAEGREIRAHRWTFDQYPITNSIVATGIGTAKKRVRGRKGRKKWVDADYTAGPIRVSDEESIARHGLLEEFLDLGFVGNETGLENRARQELAAFGNSASDAVELTLCDADGAFGKFDVGDTIRVELGLAGISGRVRVHVLSLDVSTGTMIASGLGVADE
jgi:hypothetical protein